MDVVTLRDHWMEKLRVSPIWGNLLFWISFIIYMITQFSQGTMFIVKYPSDSFPYRIFMVAGVLAFAKILLFNKFKNWHELALYTAVGLLILVSCQHTGHWELIYYFLLMVAAQNIKMENIIRLFLIAIVTGLIITFISAHFGLIMNMTNSRNGDPGVRFALGMVFPTDLASRAFYLQLFYIVYRRFRLNLPEFIACLAFTILIFTVTNTRLDLILMLLTLLAALFYRPLANFLNFVGNTIISVIGVLGIAGVIGLTYIYSGSNPVFALIDKALSGRLSTGHKAFVKYNVKTFGQFVPQNGNGGIHHGPFDYFFIDCSFLRILMMNGSVAFVIVVWMICFLSKKFMNNGFLALEIALILVVLSSLIDHHMDELSFNIMFMALFSNLSWFKQDTFLQLNRKKINFI